MNQEIMNKIMEKIRQYDRILIFRHFRPDGDAIGSTKGLQAILRATYPEKEILLQNNDSSDYLAFLGPEDAIIEDEKYADALAIVLDTGTADRVSNQKFTLCKEVVKIDHHIDNNPYGDYSWVEDQRSSACEMVVKFYDTFKDELKLTKEAATYLYTGMVTDSGRFRFNSVSGDTMRYAGILLDQKLDTDVLFANLYLEDFDYLKFKAYIYKKMKLTENGVAYLFVDKAMQEKFGLTSESASATVSSMDSIRGSICWLAFIESQDEEDKIRVRLRSRFMPINHLAEAHHGGGHAFASGATVFSRKEMRQLIKEADACVKEYKENNEGWL